MSRPTRGAMRHLGVLRGSGVLRSQGAVLGDARYEIDGYRMKPGEVVGSGEISMTPDDLANALGRRDLELTTEDGRVLAVRFSGGARSARSGIAHADITGGLPAEDDWRR
ncbi:hypothetical protein [Reyranella sp.]|uniref:hypothetical protein n=1 Tax=Reyranella sp. TaxID=1929291 RepID=UPI003BAAE841